MSKDTETQVSNEPWLDPEKEIKMTVEPQAKSSLGGHAVPQPGHLVTYSQEGIAEDKGGDWTVSEEVMFPDDVPADAPPVKVVAGGGTSGPKAKVDNENAVANAEFVPAPTAETSDPKADPEYKHSVEGGPKGTSSTLDEQAKVAEKAEVKAAKEAAEAEAEVAQARKAAAKKTTAKKSTTKKSAGAGAGATTSTKGN